ncbi:hypothetical protein [Lactococcus sp. DD01]|uniref:hypothetical protein n=1 Tax=Lactococcus sp. DD01 TaxID=1776443 RepID=UPI000776281E|nr:hypothetical protein [Lactococcus sp. DD01]KXT63204.1 hypothetical protein LACDD01_00148 [Lactococcus sp. DD01]
MFDKRYIKRGDEINFSGYGLMKVIDISKDDIIVGKSKFDRKGAKLNSFRVSKINGRLYAKGPLHNVYGL